MNEHAQLKSWTAFHVCYDLCVWQDIFKDEMKKYEKNLITDWHKKENNQIFNAASNLVLLMASFIDYMLVIWIFGPRLKINDWIQIDTWIFISPKQLIHVLCFLL